ncbi:hypothetical protein DITRI_Ditri09bG0101000 [Diplodiscus trichospermus]
MKEGNSEEKVKEYLNSLPVGYRFKPHDVELIYYLKMKVYNKPLPPNKIREVQLYNYDPETLTGNSDNKSSSNGAVSEWYFFTPRDRKYPNGKRPGRGAGDGFWKATGADKKVMFKGHVVGFKKTLVFYRGAPSKSVKTSWIMHEFVLNNPPARQKAGHGDMRLDDWVLCRVYNKKKGPKPKPETQQQVPVHHQKQKEAEDAIPAQSTAETQKQEYGIPPPQSESFQANDSNVLPQQTFTMAFHDAYHDSISDLLPEFPESYFDPKVLEHNFTSFPEQQALSGYGDFIPTAAPISSLPPDPFHSMAHGDLNIYQQLQQQPNFEFSADDKILLSMDFGLPKI